MSDPSQAHATGRPGSRFGRLGGFDGSGGAPAGPATRRSRACHRGCRTAAQSQALCHGCDEMTQVTKRRGARTVRVFGSVARGDAGPGSDLDLLVEMDRRSRPARLQWRLSASTGDRSGPRASRPEPPCSSAWSGGTNGRPSSAISPNAVRATALRADRRGFQPLDSGSGLVASSFQRLRLNG